MFVDCGVFPAATPSTKRLAQRTVTELIGGYPVANASVRQLLIDYIGHASSPA